jgi:hypothetical protein
MRLEALPCVKRLGVTDLGQTGAHAPEDREVDFARIALELRVPSVGDIRDVEVDRVVLQGCGADLVVPHEGGPQVLEVVDERAHDRQRFATVECLLGDDNSVADPWEPRVHVLNDS